MTICKICEQDKPGKRKVCLDCKIKYPYVPAPTQQMGGGAPFNRKELWLADQAKLRKEAKQDGN